MTGCGSYGYGFGCLKISMEQCVIYVMIFYIFMFKPHPLLIDEIHVFFVIILKNKRKMADLWLVGL